MMLFLSNYQTKYSLKQKKQNDIPNSRMALMHSSNWCNGQNHILTHAISILWKRMAKVVTVYSGPPVVGVSISFVFDIQLKY